MTSFAPVARPYALATPNIIDIRRLTVFKDLYMDIHNATKISCSHYDVIRMIFTVINHTFPM